MAQSFSFVKVSRLEFCLDSPSLQSLLKVFCLKVFKCHFRNFFILYKTLIKLFYGSGIKIEWNFIIKKLKRYQNVFKSFIIKLTQFSICEDLRVCFQSEWNFKAKRRGNQSFIVHYLKISHYLMVVLWHF